MYFVASSYSRGQEADHLRYNNESSQPLTASIPMTTRDPWGPPAADYRGHMKNDSGASNVSTDQLYPRNNQYTTPYPGNAYTQEPQPTPHYTDYPQHNAVPRTQPPFGE